jgi:hypothetical protein
MSENTINWLDKCFHGFAAHTKKFNIGYQGIKFFLQERLFIIKFTRDNKIFLFQLYNETIKISLE